MGSRKDPKVNHVDQKIKPSSDSLSQLTSFIEEKIVENELKFNIKRDCEADLPAVFKASLPHPPKGKKKGDAADPEGGIASVLLKYLAQTIDLLARVEKRGGGGGGGMAEEGGAAQAGEGAPRGGAGGLQQEEGEESDDILFLESRKIENADYKIHQNQSCHKQFRKVFARIETLESKNDELNQRQRKGTIIVSSPEVRDKDGNITKKSLFETSSSLQGGVNSEETYASVTSNQGGNKSNLDQKLELIFKKTGIQIPKSEIYAAHDLPGGNSYIIKLSFRNPDSSVWPDLCKTIKNGGPATTRDMNLYLSFNLTKPRMELLKKMRQLRWEKKIEKFGIDENGKLTIRVNGAWTTITHHYNSTNKLIPTFTPDELIKHVQSYS